MKYVTLITKFYVDDTVWGEDEYSCDDILNNAIDIIQENFEDIGADGAEYYSKGVETDNGGDGKTILIDLSQCSNDKPVSVNDVQAIVAALSLASTRKVIVNCYGVGITILKDIDGFYEYVVGDRRFDNAYEAVIHAITHYNEFRAPGEVHENV